jgi:multidrug efflux system outer membrane protein
MKYFLSLIVVTSCALSCYPKDRGGVLDWVAPSFWKNSKSTGKRSLPNDWWMMFKDPVLNQLVKRAEVANADIEMAKGRVETSRALVGIDRSKLFPTLDLRSSAMALKASEGRLSQNLPSGIELDLYTRQYRSAFDLVYEPDLWGKYRNSLEATKLQLASAEAGVDAMKLGVAAEVCRQYFLWVGLDRQQRILNHTIDSRKVTIGLLDHKMRSGLVDGVVVSKAKIELELANHDLASVMRQRGSAEHALAVLCGVAPAGFKIPQRKSEPRFVDIGAGLPAEVLSRRPDVRSAEWELRAANARIKVAEAAFYPSFNLSGGGGFESVRAADFLAWENRILSLGAGVTAPVFRGGLNRANFQGALSQRDVALGQYRKVLLVALREVEDAMVDLQGMTRSVTSLQDGLKNAQEVRQFTSERYEKGITSYLEVIEAERNELQMELLLAQLESQRWIGLSILAKALGGGW